MGLAKICSFNVLHGDFSGRHPETEWAPWQKSTCKGVFIRNKI